MLVLQMILSVVAIGFLLFGYCIFFKKKYNLINGFEEDFKRRRKTEDYAKRVGIIEFIIGIVILIISVILMVIN